MINCWTHNLRWARFLARVPVGRWGWASESLICTGNDGNLFWVFYFLTSGKPNLQCICVLHVMLCAICTFFLVEKGIIDLLALWRRIPSPRKKYMFIVLRNVFPGSCSFILSFLQSGIAYFFKGGQGGSNYLNVWLQLLNLTKNIDPIIRQIIFSKFTTLHWIFSFTKSY